MASPILSVEHAEEKVEPDSHENCYNSQDKNPAAVALGRLGGRKGGPARAKTLSDARRREIAKTAAEARWNRQKTE